MHLGRLFSAMALALTCLLLPKTAEAAPLVELWRLDCGKIVAFDLDQFSDTRAYVGQQKRLTGSCYLIRHGKTYMLWNTGLPRTLLHHVPDAHQAMDGTLVTTIVEQLAKLRITPEQISIIGISHEHTDHTGQAADFPKAKLLMGKGDIDDMLGPNASRGEPLSNWLKNGAPIEAVNGDKDVFSDGTVVMLDLPGHTPGHHGLLLKLAHKGYVLLSGDATHFTANYKVNGVPAFNANRAETLASLDRLRLLARNLHALLIIQYEPADVLKLPRFPRSAN